jgi:hypothetical protein
MAPENPGESSTPDFSGASDIILGYALSKKNILLFRVIRLRKSYGHSIQKRLRVGIIYGKA